jgi:hypothetical protein
MFFFTTRTMKITITQFLQLNYQPVSWNCENLVLRSKEIVFPFVLYNTVLAAPTFNTTRVNSTPRSSVYSPSLLVSTLHHNTNTFLSPTQWVAFRCCRQENILTRPCLNLEGRFNPRNRSPFSDHTAKVLFALYCHWPVKLSRHILLISTTNRLHAILMLALDWRREKIDTCTKRKFPFTK